MIARRLTALLLVSCGTGAAPAPAPAPAAAPAPVPVSAPALAAVAPAPAPAPAVAGPVASSLPSVAMSTSAARCEPAASIAVHEGGRATGQVCAEDAPARKLTILDLRDDWTPYIFTEEGAEDRQPYREVFVALANERIGKGRAWERARSDRHFELYGVPPSFAVLRRRLVDGERHACHDQVDQGPLEALDRELRRGDRAEDAVRAVQGHLACDGLLPPDGVDGLFGPATARALRIYQHRHMIVSAGHVDAETRSALLADSRELDFRALLRSLRARVVDASGLIEDGTARGERGEVLGRRIDGEAFYAVESYGGLPDGAPDLISPATETAARALGWTDPEAAIASFEGPFAETTGRVAVALPAPPAYHSGHMDLRVEIDRGDVWYDFPSRAQPVERHPRLVLFVRDGDREVPLVQWPTTIGGWKRERAPSGQLGLRYKGSPVGDRIWRDVIASPAWLPPKKTPRESLVRARGDGYTADTDLLGPGYASAYGLVMFIHHRPIERKGGTVYGDQGIRSHGSVSYPSILEGESHGCHRLFNHSAVRLAGFVLRHRPHTRAGVVRTSYRFSFDWRGSPIDIRVPFRGYRFELDPPVPVTVLEGTIRGRARRPSPRFVPLSR